MRPGLGVASTQGGCSALLQLRDTVAASAPGPAHSAAGVADCGRRAGCFLDPNTVHPRTSPQLKARKNWPKAGFSVQYVDIGAFMTLGRFLIFFVIGLVLALTIPQLTWLLWPLAASALFVVVQLIRS